MGIHFNKRITYVVLGICAFAVFVQLSWSYRHLAGLHDVVMIGSNSGRTMKEVGGGLIGKKISTLSKAPLRERLAYYYPYDPAQPLPYTIRQSWRCNPDDEDCKVPFKGTHKTWKDLNEGIKYDLLLDKDLEAFVERHFHKIPEVMETYWMLPKQILRMDFLRYLQIFALGGTYGDIDTQCLKPIKKWAPFQVEGADPDKMKTPIGMTVGIEADAEIKMWMTTQSRRIQFTQWVFQAKKGHPLLLELIARIIEETRRKMMMAHMTHREGFTDSQDVMDWTGPGIWTDTIFDYINNMATDGASGDGFGVGSTYWLEHENWKIGLSALDSDNAPLEADRQAISWKNFTLTEDIHVIDDVMVLPITGFNAQRGKMRSKPVTDPMAFVRHLFGGSWKPEELQKGNDPE